ncbi:hypothetical protein RRG08_002881 [Elysia crispata]|uniref:Uncharacterized protein n=1 Tax=Elysia crispata TaxID=231223 RepID=A0AAE1AUC0_9GAST|nr:hypothetical protein RRG08_002881 [Elysia crispata]
MVPGGRESLWGWRASPDSAGSPLSAPPTTPLGEWVAAIQGVWLRGLEQAEGAERDSEGAGLLIFPLLVGRSGEASSLDLYLDKSW